MCKNVAVRYLLSVGHQAMCCSCCADCCMGPWLDCTVFGHAKCSCCAGMHASISAHLSHEHLMNEEKDTWGPNLEEFRRRLGNTAVKQRVENMYFTYLFVLRAVMKAAPMLESVDYNTGCREQDASTKKLMQQLVSIILATLADCLLPMVARCTAVSKFLCSLCHRLCTAVKQQFWQLPTVTAGQQ